MTTFADFYSANTSPARIKAAGFGGVIFYASHQAGKCVTAADAAAARAAGLEVLLVFEDSATQASRGASQGSADSIFANAIANGIGYPADCPIFFAVDFDATTFAAIDAYFRAAAGHGRPVGVYGGLKTVNAVMGANAATVAWQTLAWSGGHVSAYASLYQSAIAVPFDTDRVLKPITSWGGTEPVPAPTPTPEQAMAALNRPICAVAYRPQGDGYWLIGQDGGVFNFGGAPGFTDPDVGKLNPGHLVTACAVTASGNGLILAASDGGVLTFGDAVYRGSIPGDNIGGSTQPYSA